jgi:hypothetical protein
MSRSKSRHLGAGVLTRYRNGACTFTCRHDGCRAYWEPRNWRAGLRQARAHAADHDAIEARYAGTPWGIPAGELPRTRGRRPLRRLAVAGVALVLAAVAFVATVAGVASRAAPAPSIGIVTTTTTTAAPSAPSSPAGPATTGYRFTPAGPPATDPQGQWIPEPDRSTSTTSSAGGGR